MSLFYCKTNHSTVFKYLFDMLFHNMTTVPINITKDKFIIYSKTDNGYTFSVNFTSDKFTEWRFTGTDSVFFGLGTLNSQDFKELTSRSNMEISIDQRKSPLEPIVLKLTIVNNHRNLIKKFTLYSEEIPFFPPSIIIPGEVSLDLTTQDFTSLCKGFKTGVITMRCSKDGFSILSKLEGVREKCFLVTTQLNTEIEKTFSADKFLGVIKLAMCAEKVITMHVDETRLILFTKTVLGPIIVALEY